MAVIYLKHETHGAKVACSEQEAAADETGGWTRFTVIDPVAVHTASLDIAAHDDAGAEETVTYVVTPTNGMQPENAMPKPRRASRQVLRGHS
jgi:hypothetical protein